jgi:hypothetical protein
MLNVYIIINNYLEIILHYLGNVSKIWIFINIKQMVISFYVVIIHIKQ